MPVQPPASLPKTPEVAFALAAMEAAGEVLQALGTEIERSIHKEDATPVTAADFAVQAVIAGLLEVEQPRDALLAEEGSALLRSRIHADLLGTVVQAVERVRPGSEARQILGWLDYSGPEPSVQTWALDPIDGTAGLLRGREFVTALALLRDGQVELGALLCPRSRRFGIGGCVALAVRGAGAWAAGLPRGEWRRLQATAPMDGRPPRLIRSVESGRTTRRRLARIREDLGMAPAEIALDGQVKYLALAAGDGELAVRLPRRDGTIVEHVWDHAAGVLLVEEAGGEASDVLGTRLDFGRGRRLEVNLGVVASAAGLHPRAIDAIGRLLTDDERGQARLRASV